MDEILYLAKGLSLPERDINDIAVYLEHDEWGLAFEVLCISITENGLTVNKETFYHIMRMGEQMKMPKGLWDGISYE